MNSYFTSEVIVISELGEHLGKMSAGKARALAKDRELDLVEISKQDGLSLCKIMDEGKYLYEQKKKSKQQHSNHYHLKEIKFSINIAKHDFDTKIKHIDEFIQKGYDVRLIVELHGREKSHPENALTKMKEILNCFNGKIKSESVKSSGGSCTVLIHPEMVKNG